MMMTGKLSRLNNCQFIAIQIWKNIVGRLIYLRLQFLNLCMVCINEDWNSVHYSEMVSCFKYSTQQK